MVDVEIVEVSKADDVWRSSVEVAIVLVTRAGEAEEALVGDVGEALGVTGAGKAVDA